MAFPWMRRAYPWAFPMASPWARRAGDVAPYHGCGRGAGVRTWRGAWAVHGAVHDGRGRRPRRPAYPWASPLASLWARRAGDVAPYHGCGRGAGVRTWYGAWALHGAGRGRCMARGVGVAWRGAWALRGAGHGRCVARCMVGADVPGGLRTRGCPRWRPRGRGAPGTSRPTMCARRGRPPKLGLT